LAGAQHAAPLRLYGTKSEIVTHARTRKPTLGWPVYLALALLLIFTVALVIAFAAIPSASLATSTPISAASYSARVNALLRIGQPEDAEAVIETFGCPACHRVGAQNGVAPSWVGIAARAGTRRPPLSAAEYVYESIVNPSAYVVSGYSDIMPKDFGQRLSDQQLADLIAYLLTPDAH